MITVRGKDITAINVGNRALQAVYHGARLVWQKVKSLSAWFRSEGWFRSEPW